MSEGPGEWVDKDAFVMPLIPKELKIDPQFAALLHCVAFFELSGDDAVNPDWALEAMEHVGAYLQRLPRSAVAAMSRQLATLQDHGAEVGWPEELTEFLEGFLEGFGLEDE